MPEVDFAVSLPLAEATLRSGLLYSPWVVPAEALHANHVVGLIGPVPARYPRQVETGTERHLERRERVSRRERLRCLVQTGKLEELSRTEREVWSVRPTFETREVWTWDHAQWTVLVGVRDEGGIRVEGSALHLDPRFGVGHERATGTPRVRDWEMRPPVDLELAEAVADALRLRQTCVLDGEDLVVDGEELVRRPVRPLLLVE